MPSSNPQSLTLIFKDKQNSQGRQDSGRGGLGWWWSWLRQSYQAVKEKSSKTLQFMKRDLTELTQVVQHDMACTSAAMTSVVKEKLETEGSWGGENVEWFVLTS